METKIPFYNILNFFLIGLVFLGCIIVISPSLPMPLLENDFLNALPTIPEIIITLCFLGIVYEVGLIINRIGSTVLEPLFRKTKIIYFDDNVMKFNERKKVFPILEVLSREYALSRTSSTLFIITSILSVANANFVLFGIFIVTAAVFALSCRKHSEKIVNLMGEVKVVS